MHRSFFGHRHNIGTALRESGAHSRTYVLAMSAGIARDEISTRRKMAKDDQVNGTEEDFEVEVYQLNGDGRHCKEGGDVGGLGGWEARKLENICTRTSVSVQ